MERIKLIFVFVHGISMCFSGGPYHVRTINLNCSSLTAGDRYRIRTEAMVGMNITLCNQAWSSEEQNASLPVAYYWKNKRDTNISPPVVDLTAQEIWMKECANLTLMLHCDQAVQVLGFRFLVNLDVGEEETTTHGLIAAIVIVIGALTVALLVLAVGCRYVQQRSQVTPHCVDAFECLRHWR